MISFVINRCFRKAKDEKRTFPTNDILDTSKLIIFFFRFVLFWISVDLVSSFFLSKQQVNVKRQRLIDFFIDSVCM